MKTILSVLLCLMVSVTNAQIQIVEKSVTVNGTNNGYQITVPYGDKKIMTKELKSELKSWKGKISAKDYIFADDCNFKDMGDNDFDVYAKVEDMTKEGVKIYVMVTFGGAYISSKDDPTHFKFMEKKLYDFAVKASKNIIEEEAKAEEKVLKNQEGELNTIDKNIEKNEDLIESAKKQIAQSEEAIKKGEEDKLKKEAEIKETQAKIDLIRKKKESVK